MLKYGTFCREMLKYSTFCRKTLKYAPKKMHKLRYKLTPHFLKISQVTMTEVKAHSGEKLTWKSSNRKTRNVTGERSLQLKSSQRRKAPR